MTFGAKSVRIFNSIRENLKNPPPEGVDLV
jgi:hypothetical protein